MLHYVMFCLFDSTCEDGTEECADRYEEIGRFSLPLVCNGMMSEYVK